MRITSQRLGIILASIALVTVGGTLYLWIWAPLTVDQRIAAIASLLTAGAFVVAVLAGIIAVLAYRQATRKPHLIVAMDVLRYPNICNVFFSVQNDGQASAAFAIVWVILPEDLLVQHFGAWTKEGENSYRWEAHAGLAIHPNVPLYSLPVLQCYSYAMPIAATYTLVADGIDSDVGVISEAVGPPMRG